VRLVPGGDLRIFSGWQFKVAFARELTCVFNEESPAENAPRIESIERKVAMICVDMQFVATE
jgi:hypothetical protein